MRVVLHALFSGDDWPHSLEFRKEVDWPCLFPIGTDLFLSDSPLDGSGLVDVAVQCYQWWEEDNEIVCKLSNGENVSEVMKTGDEEETSFVAWMKEIGWEVIK